MNSKLDWLDEVVLLNQSSSEDVPGDISIFRSEEDACAAIEDWWVENSEGFAMTATGVRLVLDVVEKGGVVVIRRETFPDGHALVQVWLEALVQTTLMARRRVAAERRSYLSSAEKTGAMPTTIEGMIAYVGFPWVPPRNWFAPGCLALLAMIATLMIVAIIRLT